MTVICFGFNSTWKRGVEKYLEAVSASSGREGEWNSTPCNRSLHSPPAIVGPGKEGNRRLRKHSLYMSKRSARNRVWSSESEKSCNALHNLRAQSYFFKLLGAIKESKKEGYRPHRAARPKLVKTNEGILVTWSRTQFQAFCSWTSNFSISLVFIKVIPHGLC